jgi:spore maturation protein CgeD
MNTTRYATLINVGLKISSGDYIGYLTDDDFYLPGRLKVMVDKIESDDNIQVVYGRQHLYQYNDKIGERFHGQVLDSAACLVDHCSVLHTRWITHTVGMWDDNPSNWGAADASYWTEISKNGFKFYPVDYPTDVHRFHSDSVQARLTRGESDLN